MLNYFLLIELIFREIQKRINKKLLKDKFDFLNDNSVFQSLNSNYECNITKKIILKIFEVNTKIISNEEIDDNLYSLYIIKEGSVL